MTYDGLPSSYSTWSDIPLSLLQSEILRRQEDGAVESSRPSCGSKTANRHYNTPLHVFALFLILILSTLACSFPLVAKRFPHLPIPKRALFICRHFGTGVLTATAFVHLLPTAYTNLTDPCLPAFWNDGYPAMTGFIAMCSVFVVLGIEMFFAMQGASHSHDSEFMRLDEDETALRPQLEHRPSFLNKPFRPMPLNLGKGQQHEDIALQEQGKPFTDTPSPPSSASSLNKPLPPEPPPGEDSEAEDEDDLDFGADELDPLNDPSASNERLNGSLNGNGHVHKSRRQVSFAESPDFASAPSHASDQGSNDAHEQRLVVQCLMLEAGILFHSVFIGMALSVSTGGAFVVLLIAISFHQTFEGLALGSRIASINTFSTSSPKPWLMSFMYGVTTPIGQAIGLAVHGLYDPESQVGLLMVGIVNAISSGLLLYAGLVQLLAEDFLSDRSYIDLQGRRRLEACGAVVAGSMLMALVGAWA